MPMLISVVENVDSRFETDSPSSKFQVMQTIDTSSQLKEIFADLRNFEIGELSRLCISRDFFDKKGGV